MIVVLAIQLAVCAVIAFVAYGAGRDAGFTEDKEDYGATYMRGYFAGQNSVQCPEAHLDTTEECDCDDVDLDDLGPDEQRGG